MPAHSACTWVPIHWRVPIHMAACHDLQVAVDIPAQVTRASLIELDHAGRIPEWMSCWMILGILPFIGTYCLDIRAAP